MGSARAVTSDKSVLHSYPPARCLPCLNPEFFIHKVRIKIPTSYDWGEDEMRYCVAQLWGLGTQRVSVVLLSFYNTDVRLDPLPLMI